MSLSKDLIMFTQNFHHSRRLLSLDPPPPANLPGGDSYSGGGTNSFDANVVMVLSVLLCALICSLGLNSIVRCALRCSNLVATASPETASPYGGGVGGFGVGGTGIKKKALKTFPTVSFGSAEHLALPGLDGECAICLSEFAAGDKLRLLPKCYHGFHVRCIDKWLNSHSSCPKCRHNLLDTCKKIVGGGATSSVNNCPATTLPPPPPLPVVVVDISPLEHEGPVRNYRGDSC